MSSGSYLPPPVKAVEIAKAGGKGVRVLGVPTVGPYDPLASSLIMAHDEPLTVRDLMGLRTDM
jgi:RNA-directed DNA polymerase